MKTNRFIFILSIFLIISCNSNKNNDKFISENKNFISAIYIDTNNFKGIYCESKQMQKSEIDIQFIDTFSNNKMKVDLNTIRYYSDYLDINPCRYDFEKSVFNDSSCIIIIDTNKKFADFKKSGGLQMRKPSNEYKEYLNDYNEKIKYEILERKDKNNYYFFYPVYIINNSDSIVSLSCHIISDLTAIQEAKDFYGVWRPIEYRRWEWCGSTFTKVLLKPNHYIFSRVRIYKGNFNTQIRLKIFIYGKFYYSEPFFGSINYSQFYISKEILERGNGLKSMFLE